ncbi:tetratricopeptide repeat protein [Actinomycetota bacterium Odt1-20B]
MERELERLAKAGARVLVRALSEAGPSRWARAKYEFMEFFRQAGVASGYEASLDLNRREARLEPAGGESLTPLRMHWERELTAGLARNARSAEKLRSIVAEFGPRPESGIKVVPCADCGALNWSGSPRCEVCGTGLPREAAAKPRRPSAVHNAINDTTIEGPVIQSGTIGEVTVQPPRVQGDHIDFSNGDFKGAGPVIGVQNNYGTRPDPNTPAMADSWPTRTQLRRLALGVHPARRSADTPGLPPYIARDCDGELTDLVREATVHGGLVVVTGEPMSGKTSTAWAALRAGVAEDARVFVAQPGTDLHDLPAQLRGRDRTKTHVVWLDDLAVHLDEKGRTAGLLAQLTGDRVLVLATMRDEAYDAHRFTFDGHPAARVLRVARTVEVPARWSEAELARLAEADDARLADAVRWRGDRSVPEFLALGPELWDEWRRARRASGNPLGHLLVRAAIDLARCGLPRGVDRELLKVVCEAYEEHEQYQAHGGGTDFDAALAWATAPRHGGPGLLVPGEWDDTWRACGSLIADAARAPAETGPVPDGFWVRVHEELDVHDPRELADFVTSFQQMLVPRAATGDAFAMAWLGALAEYAGDTETAEGWYGKAAHLGHTKAAASLGRLLARRGAEAEAIPHLEAAAEAGEPGVLTLLGRLHQMRAVHYFRRAEAAGGDADATARLKGPLVPLPMPPRRRPDS